jgi:hypothetical protein
MLFKGLKEVKFRLRGPNEYGDWFPTHRISGAKNYQLLKKALELSTVKLFLAFGFEEFKVLFLL